MPYADKRSQTARECQRRASKKHYDSTREKQIARAAEWNKNHRQQINELAAVRRAKKLPPEKVLWNNARNRAKAQGLQFDLTLDDLKVPCLCPVLAIPLVVQNGHARANSPSVDRIDPSLGYLRSNVRVISHKANTIKSNATIEEIRAVLAYMEREK